MTIIGKTLDVFGPTKRFGEYYAKPDVSGKSKARGGASATGLIDEDFEGILYIDDNFKQTLIRRFNQLHVKSDPLPYEQIKHFFETILSFKIAADADYSKSRIPNKLIYTTALDPFIQVASQAIKHGAVGVRNSSENDSTINTFVERSLWQARFCAQYVDQQDLTMNKQDLIKDIQCFERYSSAVYMIMGNFYRRTAKK